MKTLRSRCLPNGVSERKTVLWTVFREAVLPKARSTGRAAKRTTCTTMRRRARWGTAKRWKGHSVGRLDIRGAPHPVRYNCRVSTRQFRYIAHAGNSRCARFARARTGEGNALARFPVGDGVFDVPRPLSSRRILRLSFLSLSRRAGIEGSRATYRMIPGRDHISKPPRQEAEVISNCAACRAISRVRVSARHTPQIFGSGLSSFLVNMCNKTFETTPFFPIMRT